MVPTWMNAEYRMQQLDWLLVIWLGSAMVSFVLNYAETII